MEKEQGKIYKAIIATMKDLQPIKKVKDPGGKLPYASTKIDDIYDALHPLFCEHGMFIVPEIISERLEERPRENKAMMYYCYLTVKFTVWAEDGSFISGSACGEAMDAGDKSTPKAMTMAEKSFLSQLLKIRSTQKNTNTTGENKTGKKPPGKKPPPPKTEEQPIPQKMKDGFAIVRENLTKTAKVKPFETFNKEAATYKAGLVSTWENEPGLPKYILFLDKAISEIIEENYPEGNDVPGLDSKETDEYFQNESEKGLTGEVVRIKRKFEDFPDPAQAQMRTSLKMTKINWKTITDKKLQQLESIMATGK